MHRFRTTRLDASLALLQGITHNLPAGLANYNWESPGSPLKHPLLFLGIWRLYVKCNLLCRHYSNRIAWNAQEVGVATRTAKRTNAALGPKRANVPYSGA